MVYISKYIRCICAVYAKEKRSESNRNKYTNEKCDHAAKSNGFRFSESNLFIYPTRSVDSLFFFNMHYEIRIYAMYLHTHNTNTAHQYLLLLYGVDEFRRFTTDHTRM